MGLPNHPGISDFWGKFWNFFFFFFLRSMHDDKHIYMYMHSKNMKITLKFVLSHPKQREPHLQRKIIMILTYLHTSCKHMMAVACHIFGSPANIAAISLTYIKSKQTITCLINILPLLHSYLFRYFWIWATQEHKNQWTSVLSVYKCSW